MLNYQMTKIFCALNALAFLMLANTSIAAPPLPFSAHYDARFQGLKAQAEISLIQINDTEYIANSSIKVRLFGATVSSIKETSQFSWYDNAPRTLNYEYKQSGIGGRSSSITYDWQNNLALATVENDSIELQLTGNTFDELSMYSFIKEELNKGAEDITFAIIDRNVVKDYHYRAIGEEEVITDAGIFAAIKVERIRENSERITQLWFAKYHDMLLIKLFQRDPDGDEFEITLSEAHINSEVVRPQESVN